jgi:phage terminase large subunit-like protein
MLSSREERTDGRAQGAASGGPHAGQAAAAARATTEAVSMNPIDAYARDVDSGRIPAGKYHRLACQRHLRDRQREGTPAFPYRFDMAKAQRFASFVGLLKHYKGEWAGTPIQLQPWQLFILGSLFGWVHAETGLRRFRSTYFEMPRKNGKSTIAATAALYLAFFDGEPGAEGYTVATKRDQAKIVFADAKKMVESSGLKSRIGVRVANLHRTDTSCKLEPLGADHDSTDGLNPHLVVIDEWHAYKDRGLIDVMETATGARRQPVIFGITTAGNDPVSPCGDQHDYACKVLDGVLVDESLLTFVRACGPRGRLASRDDVGEGEPELECLGEAGRHAGAGAQGRQHAEPPPPRSSRSA